MHNFANRGLGATSTCKKDDFRPRAGFHETYEEIGRAFVQAQKEGWKLCKQHKNETRGGKVLLCQFTRKTVSEMR